MPSAACCSCTCLPLIACTARRAPVAVKQPTRLELPALTVQHALSGAVLSIDGVSSHDAVADLRRSAARSLGAPVQSIRLIVGQRILQDATPLHELGDGTVLVSLTRDPHAALQQKAAELAGEVRQLRQDLSQARPAFRSGAARLKRVQDEFNQCMAHPEAEFAVIDGIDPFHVQAVVLGTKGTPYEDRLFVLHIFFSDNYPYHPPVVCFDTKIFHTNVSQDGVVCLDIFQDQWTPALTIRTVLLSVLSILDEASTENPANPEAAGLWQHDRDAYEATAREWAVRHAD